MHVLRDLIANALGRTFMGRSRRGRSGTRVAAMVSRAESLESRAMLSGVSASLAGWSHLLHHQPALHGVLTDGISDLIRNSVPARYQSQLNSLLSSSEPTQPLPAWHTKLTERIDNFIDAAVPSNYRSAVHNAVDAVVEEFHDDFVAVIPAPVLTLLNRLSGYSAAAPVTASVTPQVNSQTETLTSVPEWHEPLTEVIDDVVSSICDADGSDTPQFVDDFVEQNHECQVESLPPGIESTLSGPESVNTSIVDDSASPTVDESGSLPPWHDAVTETISDVIDRLPSQYREQAVHVVDHFVAKYHDELVTAVDRLPAGLLDEVFSFVGRRRGWLGLFA